MKGDKPTKTIKDIKINYCNQDQIIIEKKTNKN